MGIFDGLLGHASRADVELIQREVGGILLDEERVERAYKLIRDLIIFTDKRLIMVDKQGLTGKKVSYHSVPYHSISHFTTETAGTLELDSVLQIHIIGGPSLHQEFKRGDQIFEIQRALAHYIL